jgi:hypothetical protein
MPLTCAATQSMAMTGSGRCRPLPGRGQGGHCVSASASDECLATLGYSRVLSEAAVREHFRNETIQAQFRKLDDVEREAIWGEQVDISYKPLARRSPEHTGRAISTAPVR